jgi:hypothetical protein
MTIAVWFWLFYVLSILCVVWREYNPSQPYPFLQRSGWYVVLYVLLGLLGWKVFGSPVQ